jgi:hypothetical protein
MRLTLLAAVLLVAAPSAVATWTTSAASVQEPSTAWDAWDGWMWHDPPAAGSARLYLDARYVPTSTGAPLPHFEATLGVWRDCNGDGIVGHTAAETYPALALLDVSQCPPGTRHNDGSTITELLYVGPGAAYPHIADADARVWTDRATPHEAAPSTKTYADHVHSFLASAPRWRSVGNAGLEPEHATTYAYVSPGVLGAYGIQTPRGEYGAYGAWHCGGGASGNWDCNAANWLTAPALGQPYVLRDVDCKADC